MIRGVIFDFDGLIVDTEWSVYKSWVDLYDSLGAELPLDQWTSIIGTSSKEHFDPFEVLEHQLGRPVNRQELGQSRHDREMKMALSQPILPGVEEAIKAAQKRNLKLGIASSSDRKWVTGHLAHRNLLDYFEVVHTSDDVEITKPDPALYQLTLKSLGISPGEAIVFEDSPNGVRAAKDAGIFTVAVPNRLTADLDFNHADLMLESLAETSLPDLILAAEKIKIAPSLGLERP